MEEITQAQKDIRKDLHLGVDHWVKKVTFGQWLATDFIGSFSCRETLIIAGISGALSCTYECVPLVPFVFSFFQSVSSLLFGALFFSALFAILPITMQRVESGDRRLLNLGFDGVRHALYWPIASSALNIFSGALWAWYASVESSKFVGDWPILSRTVLVFFTILAIRDSFDALIQPLESVLSDLIVKEHNRVSKENAATTVDEDPS